MPLPYCIATYSIRFLGHSLYPPNAHTNNQPQQMAGPESMAYDSSAYNRALYPYSDSTSGWGYNSVTDQSSPDSIANSGTKSNKILKTIISFLIIHFCY